ncbi:MAG: S8 family serine peptidase [Thermoplasmatota archaeon]
MSDPRRGRAACMAFLMLASLVAALPVAADEGSTSGKTAATEGRSLRHDPDASLVEAGTTWAMATDVTASLDGTETTYHPASGTQARAVGEQAPGSDVPVYRPLDRPDDPALHRFGTHDVLLRHTGFPTAAGLGVLELRYTGLENLWLARIADPFEGPAEATRLAGEPGVLAAEPVLVSFASPDFTPTDPLFPEQWHLHNTGQSGGLAGLDIGWVAASDLSTGASSHVNVIDDGVVYDHPDLDDGRYVATSSDDHCAGGTDPAPSPGDNHGTSVAGLIAATAHAPEPPAEGPGGGMGGIGGVGVAPDVAFSAQRLIACGISSSDVAEAFTLTPDVIDVYTNSWGFTPGASMTHPLRAPAAAAYASARDTGREGLGNLIVWSAGNGAVSGDSAAYDEHKTQRSVIPVAAIGNGGVIADYSEGCSCLIVAAPSSGGTIGQTTTDIPGTAGYDTTDYTCQDSPSTCFGGTSGAAPVVAGVIALMLDVNPALTWRDVHHILAVTADSDIVTGPTEMVAFETNAAGHAYHHRYGFGVVDAEAAVTTASTWTNLGPERSTTIRFNGPAEAVPDGTGGFPSPGDAVAVELVVSEAFTIEDAVLEIDATHTYENDLEVVLVSPCGTRSTILSGRGPDAGADLVGHTVTSRHFLGESTIGEGCEAPGAGPGTAEGPASGTWIVEVRDLAEFDTGSIDALTLSLYGHDAVTGNRAPVADAGPDQVVRSGDVVVLDGTGSSDPDGDPLTYQWTQTAGPPIALDDDTAPMPSFEAPSVATRTDYAWELVVDDGQPTEATSDPDTFALRVKPVRSGGGDNQPPVADAGPVQTVTEGALVQLDATGSSDPDGDAITCQWQQRRGTAVTLDDPASCTPSFTAPTAAGGRDDRLVFALRVRDEHGAKDVDKAKVQVEAAAP